MTHSSKHHLAAAISWHLHNLQMRVHCILALCVCVPFADAECQGEPVTKQEKFCHCLIGPSSPPNGSHDNVGTAEGRPFEAGKETWLEEPMLDGYSVYSFPLADGKESSPRGSIIITLLQCQSNHLPQSMGPRVLKCQNPLQTWSQPCRIVSLTHGKYHPG